MGDAGLKRPAFQFYPADWRKDAALQSCSLAAQGLWINMMCIAHECEPYGHLTVNGKPMMSSQIARLVGLSQRECEKLLAELQDAGVSSMSEGGAILSRRMVRDEDLRERRAAGGKAGSEHGIKGAEHGSKGGRPASGRGDKEPPLEPPPSSSSSSSASAIPDVHTPIPPADVVGGPALFAPDPPPLPAPPEPAEQPQTQPPPAFVGTNAEAIPPRAVVPIGEAFQLPEAWGIDAERLGFKPPEIVREAEKFRQFFVAGRGAGTRRGVKGWRQSWSNWLGKAANDLRRPA